MKLKFKQNIGMSVNIAVVNTAIKVIQNKVIEQAGAELGQAQLMLGLDYTLIL